MEKGIECWEEGQKHRYYDELFVTANILAYGVTVYLWLCYISPETLKNDLLLDILALLSCVQVASLAFFMAYMHSRLKSGENRDVYKEWLQSMLRRKSCAEEALKYLNAALLVAGLATLGKHIPAYVVIMSYVLLQVYKVRIKRLLARQGKSG